MNIAPITNIRKKLISSKKQAFFAIFSVLFLGLALTIANTLDIDQNIFTGIYSGAELSYSDLHFNQDNNDFGGSILWAQAANLGTSETISLNGSNISCNKMIRAIYHNSARGNTLWPLDSASLSHLQSVGTGYDGLSLGGGFFTDCDT